MFGKSMDLGAKRDMMDAVMFYFVQMVLIAGLSTVLFHFLGMMGISHDAKAFFEGGDTNKIVGSLFVLWLGGSILSKRGLTSDMMSVIVVAAAIYLTWTSGIVLGLVPVALLTTMGKKD